MDIHGISIRHLEYLVAVVEHGSYASAAKALFVTTRAVSKSLAAFEEKLKIELFEKTSEGLTPTPHAYRLAKMAMEALLSYYDFVAYAEAIPLADTDESQIRGSLKISVATSLYEGEALPKHLVDSFLSAYQNIEMNVTYNSSGACMSALFCGDADAVVTFSPSKTEHVISSRLYLLDLCAVVSIHHPLAQNEQVTLEEVGRYPIAKPYDMGACSSIVIQRFAEKKIELMYMNPMVFLGEYSNFVHERLGVCFALCQPSLVAAYDDVTFLPFSKTDSLLIPVYLLSIQPSKPLTVFQQYLLAHK